MKVNYEFIFNISVQSDTKRMQAIPSVMHSLTAYWSAQIGQCYILEI